MRCVGFVGYVEKLHFTTVWAGHLSDECKRRLFKNWYKCVKTAFTQHQKRGAEASRLGSAEVLVTARPELFGNSWHRG